MADATPIEWTDATWNPVTGCSVVSPGCTNCYAMKLAGTRLKHLPSRAGLTIDTKAGPVWNGQVRFNAEWLDQPLRWTRPRRIFVCAHGDLFHNEVPDAWIDQVFAVMALSPQHTFQVLTKRAARMRTYLSRRRAGILARRLIDDYLIANDGRVAVKARKADRWPVLSVGADLLNPDDVTMARWPLPNVWLGVSAEDQERYDERAPALRMTPAAVRFISFEPLIGEIRPGDLSWLDWAIVGGENGPRPMHPDWVRRIAATCFYDSVAFFFKQWGSHAPALHAQRVLAAGGSGPPFTAWPDGSIAHGRAEDHKGPGIHLVKAGKKAAGRLLDGVEHNAMPEVA